MRLYRENLLRLWEVFLFLGASDYGWRLWEALARFANSRVGGKDLSKKNAKNAVFSAELSKIGKNHKAVCGRLCDVLTLGNVIVLPDTKTPYTAF